MEYSDAKKGGPVSLNGRRGHVVYGLPMIESVAVVWDNARNQQPDIFNVRKLTAAESNARPRS